MCRSGSHARLMCTLAFNEVHLTLRIDALIFIFKKEICLCQKEILNYVELHSPGFKLKEEQSYLASLPLSQWFPAFGWDKKVKVSP